MIFKHSDMSDTKMTIKTEKLEVVGAQSREKHEDITYLALSWNLNIKKKNSGLANKQI